MSNTDAQVVPIAGVIAPPQNPNNQLEAIEDGEEVEKKRTPTRNIAVTMNK